MRSTASECPAWRDRTSGPAHGGPSALEGGPAVCVLTPAMRRAVDSPARTRHTCFWPLCETSSKAGLRPAFAPDSSTPDGPNKPAKAVDRPLVPRGPGKPPGSVDGDVGPSRLPSARQRSRSRATTSNASSGRPPYEVGSVSCPTTSNSSITDPGSSESSHEASSIVPEAPPRRAARSHRPAASRSIPVAARAGPAGCRASRRRSGPVEDAGDDVRDRTERTGRRPVDRSGGCHGSLLYESAVDLPAGGVLDR